MIVSASPEAIAASKNKPAYGSKCNGCGMCCLMSPCPMSRELFKEPRGKCRALVKTDTRYVCGLITEPETFVPGRAELLGRETLQAAALILIGSGDGCDTRLITEPKNQAYNDWLDAKGDPLTFIQAHALWFLPIAEE